ncbi:MAG: hypothetical protein R3C52_02315 [Hyphomonadaceae bacterium]
MSYSDRPPGDEAHTRLRNVVADAYKQVGVSRARIEAGLLSVADIASLADALESPEKILVVGGGVGFPALVLAMLFPEARITCVDPDLALQEPELAEAARRLEGAGPATSRVLAAAAARLLRVDGRITFVAGGFSEPDTSRSVLGGEKTRTRVVGPEVLARLQPVDLAYISGLSSPEARASDIRLAASALAPGGVIVSADAVGPAGATVRAGVFEFLRYFPDFTFLHARHASDGETLGMLKRRSAGWGGGYTPPGPSRAADYAPGFRETIADLVGLTYGARPVLEVAIGEPVLGAAGRLRGLYSRTLRLTSTDWSTHFFDPVIDQIVTSLDHTPDTVLFSSDLLDFAPDEFVGRLFARLEDRKTPALFFATPPGERAVAGPMSRPVARIIDLAAGQGLAAYAPASLEFERARHEGGARTGGFGATSRCANFLLLGPEGGFRDARNRRVTELATGPASVREQVELQRIHTESSLGERVVRSSLEREDAERERNAILSEVMNLRTSSIEEKRELERALDIAREEAARLRADLGASQASIQNAESETAALRLRFEQLERQQRDAEALSHAERSRLENDLRDERGREESLRRALQQSQADAALAQDEVARLKAELEAAQAERDAASKRATETADRFEQMRSEMEGRALAAEAAKEEVELELGARLRSAEGALADARTLADAPAPAVDPAVLARIEERLETINRQQYDESAMRGRIEADQRDLADLRERSNRLSQMLEAREKEAEDLKKRLSNDSMELIAAACRESDARVGLEGVAAHISLMQRALQRFRETPDAFSSEAIPYGSHMAGHNELPGSIDVAVRRLHGEAADLSQEMARELERLSMQIRSDGAVRAERERIAAAAHRDALEEMRSEWLAYRDFDMSDRAQVNEAVERFDALLDALEARVLENATEADRLAMDEMRDRMADEETISGRVLLQENRLAHLIHAMDAMEGVHHYIEGADDAGRHGADGETVTEVEVETVVVETTTAVETELDDATAGAGDDDLDADEDFDEVIGEGFDESGHAGDAQVEPEAALAEEVALVEEFGGEEAAEHPDDEAESVAEERPDLDEPAGAAEVRYLDARHDVQSNEADEVDDDHDPTPKGGFLIGLRGRIQTFPETSRLLRLQTQLRAQFAPRGIDPRVFDPDFYVETGGYAPYQEPLHHYLHVGEARGRWPLAGFDPEYYAGRAGNLTEWRGSLLRHFLEIGVHKGVPPSHVLANISGEARAARLTPLEFFFIWERAARKQRHGG